MTRRGWAKKVVVEGMLPVTNCLLDFRRPPGLWRSGGATKEDGSRGSPEESLSEDGDGGVRTIRMKI